MKKFKKSLIAAFSVILLAVTAVFFAACHKDKPEETEKPDPVPPAQYTLTFETNGGTQIAPITAYEGEAITPPQAPVKEYYAFVGWYTNSTFTSSMVTIPTTMPKGNVTYYARYQLTGYTVSYEFNLLGVGFAGEIEASLGNEGDEVTVKDGSVYSVEGYRFLGWSLKREGPIALSGEKEEGQYAAGDKLTLGKENVTLYAQWAKEYTDFRGKSQDKVLVYEALIERGAGAAILVREGKEDKLGFVALNDNYVEFTFYFDAAEGGDIVGRLADKDRYIVRDGVQGNYLKYDYAVRDYDNYVLALDGYGAAIINRMAGSQIVVDEFGYYAYDEEYHDYRFTCIDNATGAVIVGEDGKPLTYYFTLTDRVPEDTQFDGEFLLQGGESNSYLYYDNGEFLNYRLELNGYGDARLLAYDPLGDTTSVAAQGKYSGTENYENFQGEWEFTADDSSENFRFVLNMAETPDGDYLPVYMEYNEALNKTLTEENGASTLYLDGYGSAQYTENGQSFIGMCTVNDSRTLISFTPYVEDENGEISVGGRMHFDVNWTNGTFRVNVEGILTDGTVVTGYAGTSKIVIISDGITEIADDAFNYLKSEAEVSLISVTLPASVTKIGACAFENKNTLSRVTFLSETPVAIDWANDKNPFRWPAGNFLIVVPEGTQDAYKAAWTDCPYLDKIKGSVEVTVLPEFEVEEGVLVRYNKPDDAGEKVDIVIPDEVTEIAAGVFMGLDYIVSVDLNNVTTVGESAFENCTALASVNFEKAETIAPFAFAGCYLLENDKGVISLPAVKTVGAAAFYGCERFKRVRFGEHLTSIGDTAFMECNIYEGEEALYLQLLGNEVPDMGEKIGLGNITFRIQVANIGVAIKCFENATWNKYCKHLYIPSGDEAGLYIDGPDSLRLDGRAVFNASYTWMYAIDGTAIDVYEYDEERADYAKFSGTYEGGVISLSIGGTDYGFVKAGETVTFTSQDGKYTLTCAPEAIDPDTYADNSYSGYAEVTFNGAKVQLFVAGYSTKTVKNFLDGDGKRYDFAITLTRGNTFTYQKSAAEVHYKNIACEDGSVLNIHYVGSMIYIYGHLEIVVDPEKGTLMPDNSDYGTQAENPSANVFTFTRIYQSKTYRITVTVSGDMTSFTYVYELQ